MTPGTDYVNNAQLRQAGKDGYRVPFFVGKNISGHYAWRVAVEELSAAGLPSTMYLTETPQTPELLAKTSIPEHKNMAFYEQLMIKHGYPILNSGEFITCTDEDGDLIDDLNYSPTQIKRHYEDQGIEINIEALPDPNDPAFVERIASDPKIVWGCNIRSMHYLKKPIREAFTTKRFHLPDTEDELSGYIMNAHPGDVFLYPGTNTAFWVRLEGYDQNKWTLHIVEAGMDTGAVIRTTMRRLKPNGTLLQDLMGMRDRAGSMISNHIINLFTGTPEPAIPQKQHPEDWQKKRQENVSYTGRENWLRGFKEKGIVPCRPREFLKAQIRDFAKHDPELSAALEATLAPIVMEWQQEYIEIYGKEYAGELPPEFEADPNNYFVTESARRLFNIVRQTSPDSVSNKVDMLFGKRRGPASNKTALNKIAKDFLMILSEKLDAIPSDVLRHQRINTFFVNCMEELYDLSEQLGIHIDETRTEFTLRVRESLKDTDAITLRKDAKERLQALEVLANNIEFTQMHDLRCLRRISDEKRDGREQAENIVVLPGNKTTQIRFTASKAQDTLPEISTGFLDDKGRRRSGTYFTLIPAWSYRHGMEPKTAAYCILKRAKIGQLDDKFLNDLLTAYHQPEGATPISPQFFTTFQTVLDQAGIDVGDLVSEFVRSASTKNVEGMDGAGHTAPFDPPPVNGNSGKDDTRGGGGGHGTTHIRLAGEFDWEAGNDDWVEGPDAFRRGLRHFDW